MDNNWIPLIVFGIVALVVIAFILRYPDGVKAKINTLFGTSLEVEGKKHPPAMPPTSTIQSTASQAAVVIEDSTSTKGGAYAEDGTGRGARVKGVKVADDIIASSRDENASPKAEHNDPKV